MCFLFFFYIPRIKPYYSCPPESFVFHTAQSSIFLYCYSRRSRRCDIFFQIRTDARDALFLLRWARLYLTTMIDVHFAFRGPGFGEISRALCGPCTSLRIGIIDRIPIEPFSVWLLHCLSAVASFNSVLDRCLVSGISRHTPYMPRPFSGASTKMFGSIAFCSHH